MTIQELLSALQQYPDKSREVWVRVQAPDGLSITEPVTSHMVDEMTDVVLIAEDE